MSPLLKYSILILLSIALLLAYLFGLSLSLPLQSFALIGLAAAGVVSAVYCFKKELLPQPYLLALFITGLVYFGGRAYFSPVVDFGVDDLFLILASGLLYLVGGHSCGIPHVRLALAYTTLVALILHVGSAVIQVTGGEGFSTLQWFADVTSPSGSLVTGMYGYRGSFANFVAIASMLSLSLAIMGRYHGLIRLVLGLLAALGLGGVALSGSRSAMVSLIAGGLVFTYLLWMVSSCQREGVKKYFRMMVVALGILALIGGPYVAYEVFSKRAKAGEVGTDVIFSDSARGGYWPMALSQIKGQPWLGGGSRSFSYENYQHWNPNLRVSSASPEFVHNEYLQVTTDYGLIGLIIIMFIVAAHLVVGFLRTRRITLKMKGLGVVNSNELALCVAGVVGIVIMAGHVMFDFRTHLQANLLLVTCCLLWVLPARVKIGDKDGAKGSASVWAFGGKAGFSLVIMGLSVFAGLLGVRELKAGVPLMKAKLVHETGSWNSSRIANSENLQALEASIEHAPSYRRHLKLGTIYHMLSGKVEREGDEQQALLEKAYQQYLLAEERHPYHPAIKVNLGVVCGKLGRYNEAEGYFGEALVVSGSRGEQLFGIHIKWSNVIYQQAVQQWKASDSESAENSFLRAYDLLAQSNIHRGKKRAQYAKVGGGHLRFLAASGDFEAANTLIAQRFQEVKLYRGPFYEVDLAEYYYTEAMGLWLKRQPEEAMARFLTSRKYYLQHKRKAKNKVDARWEDGFQLVEERLAFLKKANIISATKK